MLDSSNNSRQPTSTEVPESLAEPEQPSENRIPNLKSKAWRRDGAVLEAQELAEHAAKETAQQDTVGEHLGATMIGERLALHRFASLHEGYPGWTWDVSVARALRSKKVTVCEVSLTPGPDALLAPEWVPWRDRLTPDDLSRSDILPFEANDPRLQAGFEQTEDDEGADRRPVDEMGQGRPRVLSQMGVDEAADRWYNSDQGPVPGTKTNAMCSNCGFLVKITGSLGTLFGVCANAWSPDDGTVVSFDHTCGAHSETDQPKRRPQWPIIPSRFNDSEVVFEEES